MSCDAESKPHNLGFEYIELVGQKVRLRPTTADDADNGSKLLNDSTILQWLCWDSPPLQSELGSTYGVRWPEGMRKGTRYGFAIEENAKPGAMIGCIDVRILSYSQQFEVGYWLGSPYWGQGYAQEALALICHLCFRHLEAAAVMAGIFVGNLASLCVQKKNNFQFEGTLRRQIFKDGKWIDLWHLSLVREEWEKRAFIPISEKLVPHPSRN